MRDVEISEAFVGRGVEPSARSFRRLGELAHDGLHRPVETCVLRPDLRCEVAGARRRLIARVVDRVALRLDVLDHRAQARFGFVRDASQRRLGPCGHLEESGVGALGVGVRAGTDGLDLGQLAPQPLVRFGDQGIEMDRTLVQVVVQRSLERAELLPPLLRLLLLLAHLGASQREHRPGAAAAAAADSSFGGELGVIDTLSVEFAVDRDPEPADVSI